MRLKVSRDQAEVKKQTREGSNNESAYEASPPYLSGRRGLYAKKVWKGTGAKETTRYLAVITYLRPVGCEMSQQ